MSFFGLLFRMLAFPFRDPNWTKKLGIGFLLMISSLAVPFIPAWIATGYCYRIMRRILVENGEPSLPEWDDWGGLLSDGVKFWGVSILYSLPMLLFLFAGAVMMLVPVLLSVLISTNRNLQTQWEIFPYLLLGLLIGFALIFLGLLIGSALSLFQQAGLSHMARKGEFKAAFEIKGYWPILRAGLGPFLAVLLLASLFGAVIMMVGQVFIVTVVLMPLFPFFVALYTFLLMLYLYTFAALAYREGMRRLAASH